MLKVMIGFDAVETVAYHVCVQSILKHSSVPVSFCPIILSQLPEYTRDRDPQQSNEFSFTRFLTPYLAGYEGKAIFMDCDMILRADIKELFDQLGDEDVMVVQHDYTPSTKTKYLGAIQYQYPRKNWSSVMLFNCSQCTYLTPHYVNYATPQELHQLQWADTIGELDAEWNHLVGEYVPNPKAKLVHWTIGTPCFEGYEDQEFAGEWRDIKHEVNYSVD